MQIAQGNLAGAADTVNHRSAPYYAYLNRSDVYLKVAEKCDVQREFAPCYEAVEHSLADLQQARTVASQLGYAALVRQTDDFLKELDVRRQLIKSQETSHQQTQNMGKVFHPKAASDVLVTQQFVSRWSAGEIPPALIAQYQQSAQQQQKLGPLGGVAAGRVQFIAIPKWAEVNYDDWLRRVEMFYNIGSRIIKFHMAPGTMHARGWRLDSPGIRHVMQEAVDRNMILMSHVGDPDTWYNSKYADSAKYGTRELHFQIWESMLAEYKHHPWHVLP